jgi:hypothetical protein
VAGHGRQAETTTWTGALGPAHGLAAGAAAQPVATHQWPRLEEVVDMIKRGPRSLRRARRGVMGLTKVVWHRRGGGAAATRRVFDGNDASLWPTASQTGSWGPEREGEHGEVRLFWLGEGEQRSSPWSKEGGSLSTRGARGGPLHGEVLECGIISARGGGSGSVGAQGGCGSAVGSSAGRAAQKGLARAALGC